MEASTRHGASSAEAYSIGTPRVSEVPMAVFRQVWQNTRILEPSFLRTENAGPVCAFGCTECSTLRKHSAELRTPTARTPLVAQRADTCREAKPFVLARTGHWPHLHRDWARRTHVRSETGLILPASYQ